jgi:hypothetical protein
MRGLVAALALLAAAPAAAQSDRPSHSTVPPALLVPSEQARSFFEALRLHPMSDEMMERVIQGGTARPMDEVIEQMFARGPAVPDWQNLGVDEDVIVAGLGGGPAAYMTEGANEYGPVYGYFIDRPLENVLPPEWVLIGRRGTTLLNGPIQISVSHVSPKVVLVERTTSSRHGRAACRELAESRLYADPSAPATEIDAVAVIFAMRTLAALEHRRLCSVVENLGQGDYRGRYFDFEGHSLAAFDHGSPRFRIVPFRPVPRPTAR